MRSVLQLGTAMALAGIVAPAAAQSDANVAACENKTGDEAIAGCTAAIQSGKLATANSIVLANLSSPIEAQEAPVLRLCGFDQSFGKGADTTYPRRNESRVQIDLQRGSVRFTSPGSGDWLVPNHSSISNSTISWWVGTPDGTQKISYSIERASGTYTSRLTFGGNTLPGGSRGSCLPKRPF